MNSSENTLKLVCLNIEEDKHFDRFIPFIKKIQPDVFCVQEIFESDVKILEEQLGIALFSKIPHTNVSLDYYLGSHEYIPERDPSLPTLGDNKVLLSASVIKGENTFVVATTHFTWTPNGEANEHQRKDIKSLLEITKKFSDIILCGDFNAPRGLEIFSLLAKTYKDNIPVEYSSSIDGSLHRAGQLPYMVDGLFTTPQYKADNVKLVSGLSDHCGIVAEISIV